MAVKLLGGESEDGQARVRNRGGWAAQSGSQFITRWTMKIRQEGKEGGRHAMGIIQKMNAHNNSMKNNMEAWQESSKRNQKKNLKA